MAGWLVGGGWVAFFWAPAGTAAIADRAARAAPRRQGPPLCQRAAPWPRHAERPHPLRPLLPTPPAVVFSGFGCAHRVLCDLGREPRLPGIDEGYNALLAAVRDRS